MSFIKYNTTSFEKNLKLKRTKEKFKNTKRKKYSFEMSKIHDFLPMGKISLTKILFEMKKTGIF